MATVKLERAEELALERLVQAGLFASKDEAARAAIIKYAMDLGILRREELWKGIESLDGCRDCLYQCLRLH